MRRIAPLLAAPALLAAACTVERGDRDGLVVETITPARANDVRENDPKGFISLRLADDQWLALPGRAIAEATIDGRGSSTLVWLQLIGRDRWLRREVVIPDGVLKTEALKHLMGKIAD